MRYSKGFKFQLRKSESCQTPLRGYNINTDEYSLTPDGKLTGKTSFAWDGCSGSWDTDSNKRGGLFHDIGCLMVARGELPVECMGAINTLFHKLLLEDGMTRIRAWWHYKAVVLHFAGNTKPERRKIIYLDKPDKPYKKDDDLDMWGIG